MKIKKPRINKLTPNGFLSIIVMVLFVVLFAGAGVGYMVSSHAATPVGAFDFITYEGSLTDSMRIGTVTIVVSPGGSGYACSPNSGDTNSTAGTDKGHLHLTNCKASATAGKTVEYVLSNFTRAGYTIDPNSPHKPGDIIHIVAGQTTTVSLIVDGPPPAPPPSPSPSPSPTPSPTPATPTPAPQVPVEVVTYAGAERAGNELGGVAYTLDQGGSGANYRCVKNGAYVGTDTTNNIKSSADYGKAHITCPSAQGPPAGGPRTFRFVSATKSGYYDGYVTSPTTVAPGQTFTISGGSTSNTYLHIVLNPIPIISAPVDSGIAPTSGAGQPAADAPDDTPADTPADTSSQSSLDGESSPDSGSSSNSSGENSSGENTPTEDNSTATDDDPVATADDSNYVESTSDCSDSESDNACTLSDDSEGDQGQLCDQSQGFFDTVGGCDTGVPVIKPNKLVVGKLYSTKPYCKEFRWFFVKLHAKCKVAVMKKNTDGTILVKYYSVNNGHRGKLIKTKKIGSKKVKTQSTSVLRSHSLT